MILMMNFVRTDISPQMDSNEHSGESVEGNGFEIINNTVPPPFPRPSAAIPRK